MPSQLVLPVLLDMSKVRPEVEYARFLKLDQLF